MPCRVGQLAPQGCGPPQGLVKKRKAIEKIQRNTQFRFLPLIPKKIAMISDSHAEIE